GLAGDLVRLSLLVLLLVVVQFGGLAGGRAGVFPAGGLGHRKDLLRSPNGPCRHPVPASATGPARRPNSRRIPCRPSSRASRRRHISPAAGRGGTWDRRSPRGARA